MAKERADLVNEALVRLGALSSGQEAGAEDYDYVDDNVGPVLDNLSQRGVFHANPSDIPDAALPDLASCLAYHCRGYFGVVGQELADLASSKTLAERDLRILSRSEASCRPLKVEFF